MKNKTEELNLRIFRGNFIIYNKLIFTLIVLLSTIILLFPFCSGKTENISKPKVLDIYNVREIPQDENFIVSSPIKMLSYAEKIYILDRKSMQILVFTYKGYSHSIGRQGQGPGDIFQPFSFDIADEKLYVANIPDRIEVFDLTGIYLRTIRLKIKLKSIPSFWDFKIFDDIFYFSKDIGQIKVQRYDMNGIYIDDFISGGRKIESRRYVLSNPFNIYLVPENNRLILFNQFNGDIETYDLTNGDCLSRIRDYDSFTMERSVLIRDRIRSPRSNEGDLNVKAIILLRSTMDIKNFELLITPSQISLEEEEKRSLVYRYNFNNNNIKETILNFFDSEKRYVMLSCVSGNKLVFLDDELNLYIGAFK